VFIKVTQARNGFVVNISMDKDYVFKTLEEVIEFLTNFLKEAYPVAKGQNDSEQAD